MKLCERIATKESDRSVGDSCVCGGPILGIRNKNIYYTVCTNLFFGIRVLSVLALYTAFDTHLNAFC